MIYTFKCENCQSRTEITLPMAKGPPSSVECAWCHSETHRDWQADAPMIDTSKCKDASEIRPENRVLSAWDRGSPDHVEAQFQRHIEKRRAEIRDAGGQRGSIKQTHAVPAHLYHGKIKETGDKDYWNDPANLNRHTECKVE